MHFISFFSTESSVFVEYYARHTTITCVNETFYRIANIGITLNAISWKRLFLSVKTVKIKIN